MRDSENSKLRGNKTPNAGDRNKREPETSVRPDGIMFYMLTIMSCYHTGVSSFSVGLGWISFKGYCGKARGVNDRRPPGIKFHTPSTSGIFAYE